MSSAASRSSGLFTPRTLDTRAIAALVNAAGPGGVSGFKVGTLFICKAARRADLSHLGMNVETRIAELGDLLGQKLHPLRGVAEDYRLVDLELEAKNRQL